MTSTAALITAIAGLLGTITSGVVAILNFVAKPQPTIRRREDQNLVPSSLGTSHAGGGVATASYDSISETPNEAHKRRRRGMIWTAIAVLALLITASILYVIHQSTSSVDTPSVTVTTPYAGEEVPFTIEISASSTNIATGYEVWVVVHQIGAKYHPDDHPCIIENDAPGTLNCPMLYIGTEGAAGVGQKFEILFVYANKTVQNDFIQYSLQVAQTKDYSGLASIPDNPKILANVTVVRS